MHPVEWSRSRFWLCHFLHNRHERVRIAWSAGAPLPGPALREPLADWLADLAQPPTDARRYLIADAVRRCSSDPAYIQCLRLMSREESYHAELAGRMCSVLGHDFDAGGGGARADRLARCRRILGIRFELSVILLSGLVRHKLLRCVIPHLEAGPLRDATLQFTRDHEAHLSFHAERLTMEYADFNFIRRNLRRMRLRAMFAALLLRQTGEARGLLKACGVRECDFLHEAWASFAAALERMVPYRRDALIAALLAQKERPYAKPGELRA